MTSISAFVKDNGIISQEAALSSTYGTIFTEAPRGIFPDKHILTSYNSVSSFGGRTKGPWSKIITVILIILYCLDLGEVLLSIFFPVRSNKLWTYPLLRCNGGKRGGKSICVGQKHLCLVVKAKAKNGPVLNKMETIPHPTLDFPWAFFKRHRCFKQLVCAHVLCLWEKEIEKEREGGGCLETFFGWDEGMPALEALQGMAALARNDCKTGKGDIFHKAFSVGRQVLG